jgi:hypothetical protein
MAVYLEAEELRALIVGEVPVRKCFDCEGTGMASYLHYTLKERPHDELDRQLSPQQAADFCVDDYPDYDWADVETDTCDSCKGIGYVCHLWGDH